MNRMHSTYQNLTRQIMHDYFVDVDFAASYEKHAKVYGVYSPTLYSEAVRLAKNLKLGGSVSAAVSRMKQWPVVYNLVVCKHIPTKRLSKVIEDKSFRPLAEELMTIIFGV